MKILLFFILLLLPFHLLAQIEIKNLSLKHPDSALLYIGVANNIQITKRGSNYELGLGQSFSRGQITYRDSSSFDIFVDKPGIDTIRLYQKGKEIAMKIYEARCISDPNPQLGYIKDSLATVGQILADPQLHCVLPGCDLKVMIKIECYDLQLYNAKNILLTNFGHTSGSKLSNEQIQEIKKLKPGSKLVFENMKARGSDSISRTLKSFTITIQ